MGREGNAGLLPARRGWEFDTLPGIIERLERRY
jgi:hypothetical protein